MDSVDNILPSLHQGRIVNGSGTADIRRAGGSPIGVGTQFPVSSSTAYPQRLDEPSLQEETER